MQFLQLVCVLLLLQNCRVLTTTAPSLTVWTWPGRCCASSHASCCAVSLSRHWMSSTSARPSSSELPQTCSACCASWRQCRPSSSCLRRCKPCTCCAASNGHLPAHAAGQESCETRLHAGNQHAHHIFAAAILAGVCVPLYCILVVWALCWQGFITPCTNPSAASLTAIVLVIRHVACWRELRGSPNSSCSAA